MSALPRWTRVVVATAGLICVALGIACFFTSPWLFGVDAYRTLARVPIGLLGALLLGLGTASLRAAVRSDAQGLQPIVTALCVATTFVPPVVGFNIGAFDRIDTAGTRTLTVVVLFAFCVATPLHACFRVLNRLVHTDAG